MTDSASDVRTTAETALRALGWDSAAPVVREVTTPARHGSNLLITAPPCPAAATPALATLVERVGSSGSILLLCPAALLEEWAGPAATACQGAPVRPLLLRGSRRAASRLRTPAGPLLLVATPSTALELQQQSLLAAGEVAAVVMAWPEAWEDQDAVATVLADVPKDSQRMVLTAAPQEITALVERHAWRAATVGASMTVVPLRAPVQTLACAWGRRVQAVADLLESREVASVSVWTVDARHHAALETVLAASGVSGSVTRETPAPAALVVAFDPPSPALLETLTAAGSTCLLVPPGTERYVRRIAAAASPVVLAGPLDAARTEADRRRAQIATAAEGALDETLLLLAPLFERHDPTTVAAAIYRLWLGAERQVPAAAPAPAAVARVWVGGGKKDSIGPNDLVGLLTRDLHVERGAIGRIEIRETFSLIEVPAGDAPRIAAALTGRTLRQRRLVAKVDEGREPREGSRGAGRERPAPRRAPRAR